MKKIKSVKFKSYKLTKEFDKWEIEDKISFSEEFIRDNEHLFQIQYEDENFEMKIPELGVLRSGYYITNYGYYACRSYASEHLSECYKIGCWFATEVQVVKELELRKTKMFVNRLIEWCDETSMIGYNETYIKNSFLCGIYYDRILKVNSDDKNNSFYGITLKSYESANLFIKQINLPKNETHRSNLIQILKSGKL